MVYPVANLVKGGIDALADGYSQTSVSYSLCHASGFLTNYGTEAAGQYRLIPANDQADRAVDFVILMIAVHTVLTIFRPRTTIEQSGLYPYRYAAYACWIIYPSLLSSLPFINGEDAYVTQGAFCALPIRPFWYRLALNWVPRYVILITILGVYVTVYLYVQLKFNDPAFQMSGTHDTVGSDALTDLDRALVSVQMDGPATASPNAALHRRHKAIQKQLRYMFIYPIIYFLMWLPPFADHCFGYSTISPPFALNTVAVACLTSQCAADCLVFSVREKPWRNMRRFERPNWRPLTLKCSQHGQRETTISPAKVTKHKAESGRRSRNWWDFESAAIGNDGGTERRTARFFSRQENHAVLPVS